ncbi:acyl carrier protein [Amycolatopsis bartoniae]|uniref:Carrier domain-containing protein n=1 Tax=Amycolatopsis bartoniae TaxID=941986 RepID=A0A8H9IUJ0_9PSEU|nr:phosphopantetheine-binding protein [Amycolatopsis bartoniae]MBB2940196.1 acyl carrier protein [Amycolatopsis bartoniae]TVT11288.1 acyl carrier protein [Amycolatopsis bartoniae]GHF66334.1 hypothetical protein GCM10017566_45140 [Amycolatopsis bartoniae]
MSSLTAVLALLAEVGLDEDALAGSGPATTLREDLGLSSVETTDLQLELRKRTGVAVDLWDQQDYTLGELEALLSQRPEPAL